MSRRKTAMEFRDLPKRYEDLVRILPPRPIHDRVAYRNTMELVDVLAGHRLNKDQRDYLEALSILVEKYEAEILPDPSADAGPLDVLKVLMEEHVMNGSDLGRLLGNRTLGYAILKGDRELSKAHIRRLAEYFKVGPGVFL